MGQNSTLVADSRHLLSPNASEMTIVPRLCLVSNKSPNVRLLPVITSAGFGWLYVVLIGSTLAPV